MNLSGHVRDGFPRVALSLPGIDDLTLTVEFILDTGFDGELALPGNLLATLNVQTSSVRPIMLADGTLRRQPYYEMLLDIDGESRRTEVLEISGNPLVGVVFLSESLLQVEITDGGEVLIEPL